MKLLICTQMIDTQDPALGFFHRWLETLALHFERIDVICLKEGSHTLPSHVHVYSLGKEGGVSRVKYIYRFYQYFTRIFFFERVDYVFFHMGAVYNVLAFPFFLVRHLFGTKFLWWKTHGKVGKLKERLALRFCDRVLTAGSKSFSIGGSKVRVVGHAIDTQQFAYDADQYRDPGACIMVGRLVPIKRIEVAILAIADVVKQNPHISLTLVGKADSEAYESSLQKQSEHVKDHVQFIGPRPHSEIPGQYARSSILLHPAFEAGFDKVVLEAMISGVIPLTSIPSFESILAPFGLYITPDNVAGYAKGIERIIGMSKVERLTLESQLRDIVIRDHSLSTLFDRIFKE